MRWRRMGSATALTSSMSGEYLPVTAAWHLAPNTRNCEARGPAPQLMYLFTASVANSVFGRVLAASLTAYSKTLSVTGISRINFWKYWISSAWMIFLQLYGFVAGGIFYNV